MRGGKASVNILKGCFLASAACLLSTGASQAENIAPAKLNSAEIQDFNEAGIFFREYVKLDKACDPKLLDLYDRQAHIKSVIVQQNGTKIEKTYDKEAFAALIKKTFADPVQAKLSAETNYREPRFATHVPSEGKWVVVTFAAIQGHSLMNVDWYLKKEEDGPWKIFSELAAISRYSENAPQSNSASQILKPVDVSEMATPNPNPDTSAEMHGIEQIRQLKRMQDAAPQK